MKCNTCKWGEAFPGTTEYMCGNENDCKYDPELVSQYEKKKLTFEEWYSSNKNMHIMPECSIAKWLWNKAQENKL